MNGISFSTARAGFKVEGEDLAIVEFPKHSVTVGVFTQNRFIAAPVSLCKQHLSQSNRIQALLINSGNANCGNGEEGERVCQQSCAYLAHKMGCETSQVLSFSTGIINQPIERQKFYDGIDSARKNGNQTAPLMAVAKAMMTTDKVPKVATVTRTINGKKIEIQGVCKGAGMIQPNMATMLAFIWTNVELSAEDLQQALNQAVDVSFNCITVDGDTSTNDSCTLTATATSGLRLTPQSIYWQEWQSALVDVCQQLAQAIVRDGEGATKLVSIEVAGGLSEADCKTVGFVVGNSLLVKTAMFAEDPNLGRIAAAVGRSGVSLEMSKVQIWLNQLLIMENNRLPKMYNEEQAKQIMQEREFKVHINLNMGDYKSTIWTTDLGYDYVKINAEYRS